MPVTSGIIVCGDQYTNAATLGAFQSLIAVQFTVANQSVSAQVAKKQKDNSLYWDDAEITFAPGSGGFDNVYGVRFRNAVAGQNATVVINGYWKDDPSPFASPQPFSGTLNPSGYTPANAIGKITSNDGSVTITDPTGPVTDLSVASSGGTGLVLLHTITVATNGGTLIWGPGSSPPTIITQGYRDIIMGFYGVANQSATGGYQALNITLNNDTGSAYGSKALLDINGSAGAFSNAYPSGAPIAIGLVSATNGQWGIAEIILQAYSASTSKTGLCSSNMQRQGQPTHSWGGFFYAGTNQITQIELSTQSGFLAGTRVDFYGRGSQ